MAQIFDLVTMVFCFFLSASVVSYTIKTMSFEQFLSMRIKVQNFLLFFVFILLWYFIFSQFKLYRSRRLSHLGNEIIDVVKAVTVGTISVFALAELFNVQMINKTFLLVFWASNCTIFILSRVMLRFILKKFRIRGRNLRFILIVGTNSRTIRFAREIESRPELGFKIIGFVDGDWENIRDFRNTEYRMVAGLNELPAFLRENVVDEVVIGLPVKSFYQQNAQIIAMCEEQGIIVRFLSELFNLKRAPSLPDQFEVEKVISLNNGTINGWQATMKHVLDFLISLMLIVFLSPVFLLVAFLIKITTPGPVFFVQERLGVNKRRFRMYKFRTMIADAEKKQAGLEHLNEVDGPAFKIKKDPRITTIGKFLRKFSIDELPQLFNVLLGDLSLVGPRPLPVRDFEGFKEDWHRRRFSVRPGITCLWQVNGRSSAPFSKWMELDMEYIDRWSLLLDFKILLKTIPAVLKGVGAG
jgi:exopolysaccharide biosynthesis polyprenyl glycosylphosphotransferase